MGSDNKNPISGIVDFKDFFNIGNTIFANLLDPIVWDNIKKHMESGKSAEEAFKLEIERL